MNALYTPNQVLAASLLGGPLAALYTLYQNSKLLQQPQQMQQIVSAGVPIVLLLLCLAPFTQHFAMQFFIPLAYSIAARTVCIQWHGPALTQAQLPLHAIRQVIMVSLVGLLAFTLLSVVWLSVMDAMGIIDLEQLAERSKAAAGAASDTGALDATGSGDRFGGFH